MKHTITFVAILFACACGEEKENTYIPHYQEEPYCGSCNVDVPDLPPISPTEGSVQTKPQELTFFCTIGQECQDVQSLLIYNWTKETTIVYGAIVGPFDLKDVPIEPSKFTVVQNTQYPYSLEPGHSLEVSVQFDWSTEIQFATLTIMTDDETLYVDLIGKLFMPVGE
jgi:hypothetical protein